MGVVIPFPADRDRRRPGRARRWVAVGALVASLTMGGVILAGRDLLRSAQVGQEASAASADAPPIR